MFRCYQQQSIRQLVVIIQNSKPPMQKSFYPLTPQKRTLPKLPFHDEHLLKELSPQLLTIGSSGCGKPKLEMLHSPLSGNSDLFSQLLQSQLKVSYEQYFQNYQICEEDSFEDELDVIEYVSEQDSDLLQDNQQEEDENGMKKRKRKSSTQIKILKKELDIVPNWTKQKIVQMSEITGLSQSQVYKWWWDQKKKNVRCERANSQKLLDKKKLIKKNMCRRQQELSSEHENENSSEEDSNQALTKPKNMSTVQQACDTSKKVNKRLTFL